MKRFNLTIGILCSTADHITKDEIMERVFNKIMNDRDLVSTILSNQGQDIRFIAYDINAREGFLKRELFSARNQQVPYRNDQQGH